MFDPENHHFDAREAMLRKSRKRLDARRKAAVSADRWFAGFGCFVFVLGLTFWSVVVWAIVRLVLEYT